jgi:hypothetical protein
MRIGKIIAALVFFGFGVSTGIAAQPTGQPAGREVTVAAAQPAPTPVVSSDYSEAGFYQAAADLTPSARAGREIWYKATAGNERFHTYVFQQRIGVLIDWFGVLRTDKRDERFKTWGMINDPGCCRPGSPNCPAKSPEETYGLDWCPGDDKLLKFVGKSGYRDAACDFKDAPADPKDRHASQRQSSCDLAFGTSSGIMGLRKFPNPLFNAAAWKQLNGGKLGTWEGYNRKLSVNPELSDSKVSKLVDGSIQPPFRIGMACGTCHIAFDPANPPADPAHPGWENLKGAIGNQYSHISEIMVSGMPRDSLEWQVFAHARPGTSDTSAVPTDQINNPGTMNALINILQRPTHPGERVIAWRKAASCAVDEPDTACWCEPGKPGKCWQRGEKEEAVHHILKDGGDSIGALGAIQRVYFNIGSCSEQCWVNHLTDLRQLDPKARNFGQTPFSIGQCRRDCPNFRAIEDRLPDILAFLTSKEATATDLSIARENMLKQKNPQARYSHDDLVADLEHEYDKGAVSRGRGVFAANCARCHSSQPGKEDFYAVSKETGLRADWLGNDKHTPASEVGTFRCRALHSNHMTGHVWDEFASVTHHALPGDNGIPEKNGGGRGQYRNISLLNLWAHAPFMHNNALGPEICGWGTGQPYDFYRPSYVDAQTKQLLPSDKQPGCWAYDPSVEGRYKLYKASMQELLYPERRIPKITKLDQDIVLDLGPKVWDGHEEKKLFGFTLRIPAGTNAGLLGNFQHKPFIVDLVQAKTQPEVLEARLVKQLGPDNGHKVAQEMKTIASAIVNDPAQLLTAVKAAKERLPLLLEVYSSCTADVENDGHRFGQDLSDTDKKALIAFLATL